jgi:hypothetical protein
MFFPTLKLLQNSDRSEGNAPVMRASFYEENMWPVVSAHQDWLLKKSNRPIPDAVNEVRDQFIRVLAIESWREQLTVRRCVSCWNRSTRQVDFMWKIYGDRGVAVFSTVGRVRRALAEAGAEGIVSPVLYIPIEDTIPKPDFDLLCANCSRPDLFKNWSYLPEQEVRFVIKVDPVQTIEKKGVLLEIMSKIIIDKVYLSPEIPSTEKLNLETFIYEKRFSRSFFQAGQEPRPRPLLAEADLPSGIFPDFD